MTTHKAPPVFHRLSSLFLLLSYALLLGLIVIVFTVKHTVLGYERKTHQLQQKNYELSRDIFLLKGEWTLLTLPERLEKLSQTYLPMTPITGKNLIEGQRWKEKLRLHTHNPIQKMGNPQIHNT